MIGDLRGNEMVEFVKGEIYVLTVSVTNVTSMVCFWMYACFFFVHWVIYVHTFCTSATSTDARGQGVDADSAGTIFLLKTG